MKELELDIPDELLEEFKEKAETVYGEDGFEKAAREAIIEWTERVSGGIE